MARSYKRCERQALHRAATVSKVFRVSNRAQEGPHHASKTDGRGCKSSSYKHRYKAARSVRSCF